MAYSTKADVQNKFGTDNVRKWSNLDNSATTDDDDRITAAIAFADAEINKRMRGGSYAVPIVGNTEEAAVILRDWSARLAGVWLYESRGVTETDENSRPINRLGFHAKYVERQIKRVLSGIDELDAVRTDSQQPTAPVVVCPEWGA